MAVGDPTDVPLPDRALVWRALLAYCGNPELASRALGVVAPEQMGAFSLPSIGGGFDEIDRDTANLHGEPRILAGVGDLGRDPHRLDEALRRLAALADEERRVAVSLWILGLDGDRAGPLLAAGTDPHRIDEFAVSARNGIGCATDDEARALLEVVREAQPPQATPDQRDGRPVGIAVAAAIAAAALVGAIGLDRIGDEPTLAVPTTTIPVPAVSAPPPGIDLSSSIDLDQATRDPHRQVIVKATVEGRVERIDGATGDRIWQSQPITDVELVSVDADIITVRSGSRSLYLNLTDGTFLPP